MKLKNYASLESGAPPSRVRNLRYVGIGVNLNFCSFCPTHRPTQILKVYAKKYKNMFIFLPTDRPPKNIILTRTSTNQIGVALPRLAKGYRPQSTLLG